MRAYELEFVRDGLHPIVVNTGEDPAYLMSPKGTSTINAVMTKNLRNDYYISVAQEEGTFRVSESDEKEYSPVYDLEVKVSNSGQEPILVKVGGSIHAVRANFSSIFQLRLRYSGSLLLSVLPAELA